MRRRRTMLALAAGFTSVALVVTFICLPSAEPVYNGKRLSEWLSEYPNPSPEARAAIRALEPKAMALMLQWIEYEPSALRTRCLRIASRLPILARLIQSQANY